MSLPSSPIRKGVDEKEDSQVEGQSDAARRAHSHRLRWPWPTLPQRILCQQRRADQGGDQGDSLNN